MASSDNPEVVERGVKDKEHKEDEKDEGKGGFIETVKGFIHDIGEKIEETIGFGTQTPIPIPLIDINYLIESDGRKLISGLIPDSGTIRAHELTIPLEKTGEIPIPYKPDIDIEKIKFERFSMEETVAILHLKLENKNDFDLGLKDLDYEVWLCDMSIGVVDLAKSAKLDKNGITYIDIPITFRPKDFGSALWNMIRGKGTGYSMKGNILVDTPFGEMKLPISKEGGTTRLKKSKEDGGDDDDDDDEE
uniref:Water stress and hypersensitive response domain-containing protein n=1 Tax=Fagus sylvatica TaxID=28930 RepID=A0A2N9IM95_FAGSY